MTAHPELTPFSQLHTFLPAGRLAPDSTLEQSPSSTDEYWPPATTALRQEHHIVLTPLVRSVHVRCTLKLTSSLTLQDMEQLYKDARYMLQTAPAIRAHVSSLMREYLPWFSTVAIETTVD